AHGPARYGYPPGDRLRPERPERERGVDELREIYEVDRLPRRVRQTGVRPLLRVRSEERDRLRTVGHRVERVALEGHLVPCRDHERRGTEPVDCRRDVPEAPP